MKSIDNLFKKVPDNWKFLLESFDEDSQAEISSFVYKELKSKTIYPEIKNIFRAYELTNVDNVKVVILGQDPYHGEKQAHGLSFSVQKDLKLPASLRNIYKELQDDLGIRPVDSGDLTKWAKQGVFLLNTVLTVEASKAGSHRKIGWEKFTKITIQEINERVDHCVFILWGAPAQKFKTLINQEKHLILESPHPSPLSSYRGFFGSKPFSQTNEFLKLHKIDVINWDLN